MGSETHALPHNSCQSLVYAISCLRSDRVVERMIPNMCLMRSAAELWREVWAQMHHYHVRWQWSAFLLWWDAGFDHLCH